MRYVPGTDLARFLRENAPLESATALSMLDQVGAALDAAHQLGLIHRDVKPGNVLLASGNCYLTDFGITKRTGAAESSAALTKTGQFLGTIGYVAPEQIEGREVDGRADIYALTCILDPVSHRLSPVPQGLGTGGHQRSSVGSTPSTHRVAAGASGGDRCRSGEGDGEICCGQIPDVLRADGGGARSARSGRSERGTARRSFSDGFP